jgi:magnesium transporter
MTMIINSVAYKKGERLGDITVEDISEVIKQPDTFVWLGLYEPDDAMLLKIQEEFHLHELAIEDARNAHQRPKLETYGDSLFIVLKTAQLEEGKVVYGGTHLFVGSNFFVSDRHGSSSSYAQVRDRCERAAKMLAKGPGFSLYALMDFVVDNYQPVVAQFERDFEAIETDIFKNKFDNLVIERLYDLKRQMLEAAQRGLARRGYQQ